MTTLIESQDSNKPARCTLAVSGMDCSSCGDTVEKALRRMEGVEDVRVDVLAYASEDDVRAGNGRALEKSTTVGGAAIVTIDGTRYWRTTRGAACTTR